MRNATLLMITALFIAILIAGCSSLVEKQEAPEVKELKDNLVKDLSAEVTENSTIIIEKPRNATEDRQKKRLAELMSLMSKVTSFTYADKSRTNDIFYVKGNKIKVKLYRKGLVNMKTYDTIVINLDSHITYGYCTDISVCSPKDREEYYNVRYEWADDKDPVKIAEHWTNVSFTGQSKQISGVETREVEFSDDKGRKGKAFMDMFYGIPIEITYSNGQKAVFPDIIINTMKDSDVQIPPDRVLREFE